jgi:SAM-dependent methyltransferase
MTAVRQSDVEEQIRELQEGRYWYQSVPIDGVVTPTFDGWAESRFYNRGKWDNFIAPLLPPDPVGLSLVELGCNAGLFLLFAAQGGFARVVGVEGDDDWFRQAEFVVGRFRRREPELYDRIELRHARIGPPGFGSNASCNIRSTAPELDLEDLGRCDVVVAANVLYWIERETSLRFIDELARAARQCLVVSVDVTSPLGGPSSSAEVREAFGGAWSESACVANIDVTDDDRVARPMFSILFTSKIA